MISTVKERTFSISCQYLKYDESSDAHGEVLYSCSSPLAEEETPTLVDFDGQITIQEGCCPIGRQCEEPCGLRITFPGAFAFDIENNNSQRPIGSRKKQV